MRIFSGIQPTGEKHLGNYIGAIRQYVASQEEGEAFICIVDLHSVTVAYDPEELRESTLSLAALLIASGLDPDRCVLFVQSHNTDHAQGAWLLSVVASFGELRRMTQFKDKADQQEFVSVGLFTYPVLQAADMIEMRFSIPSLPGPCRTSRPESVTALLTFFRSTSGSSSISTVPCAVPPVVDIFFDGSCRSMIFAPNSGTTTRDTTSVSP